VGLVKLKNNINTMDIKLIKHIISFLAGLFLALDGFAQEPHIRITTSITDTDRVVPIIVEGIFSVDSIYELDSAYLVYVTKIDSTVTEFNLFEIKAGDAFTIISFKNEISSKPDENFVKIGVEYEFSLTPSDGAWLIWPHSDFWKYSESAFSPTGQRIKVPLTLLVNQLMVSKELHGLYYLDRIKY